LIDKVLLRIMKHRSEWNKFKDAAKNAQIDDLTKAVLADFGKYFELHPSHERIEMTEFIPRFRTWHPKMKDETYAAFQAILKDCKQDADPEQQETILRDLADIELMTHLATLTERFEDGELPNPYDTVAMLTDKYKKRVGIAAADYIKKSLSEILADMLETGGIRWRLSCLNRCMRGLQWGDFGIVAGRPDKGKTSFLASEMTFMAPQMPAERNIIWLNNEGKGERIIPRLYQAAIGCDFNELAKLNQEGKAESEYAAILGRSDRIRTFDIHGFNTGQVENLLEENNPGIVVYDMIDNIKGFGDAARTDLQLEQMYQWARELCVKFDCIGIATSQISNEGDGEMFPTLGMLKDSKTGKQGACDFQLMIGASNDPNLAGLRYLGLPKNKLRKPDGPGDPRAEVIFDGQRSRYSDVPVGE
jgi:replicative DNA helicase